MKKKERRREGGRERARGREGGREGGDKKEKEARRGLNVGKAGQYDKQQQQSFPGY